MASTLINDPATCRQFDNPQGVGPTIEDRAIWRRVGEAPEFSGAAAAAEKYIGYFKKGFTADGYCSEGMGYWNYGFGNFVLLAEILIQATGGKLDLFTNPLK